MPRKKDSASATSPADARENAALTRQIQEAGVYVMRHAPNGRRKGLRRCAQLCKKLDESQVEDSPRPEVRVYVIVT